MTAAMVVRARLVAVEAVTDLVGARIFTLMPPQAPDRPVVIIETVSDVETRHLRGRDGLTRNRVQVKVLGRTKSEAESVEAAVHGDGNGTDATGLDGWKGTVGGSPIAAYVDLVESAGRRIAYGTEELQDDRTVIREYFLHWRPAA